MTIQESMGLRIKKLREEKQLSQSALAEKIGYKDKTAIAKVEAGKVDLPQSKITAFAIALDTTTAYLFGDDSHEESTNLINFEISNDNKSDLSDSTADIIQKLDMPTICQLNDKNITKLNTYSNNLLNLQRMEDEPVLMAAHNDNPTPDELEKIREDMKLLKRPE